MRARARPLFLRTVFQILFRISQSNGKNENPKTDISALKSVFGFRVRLEIRNPDFENLNPDFPIERTLIFGQQLILREVCRTNSLPSTVLNNKIQKRFHLGRHSTLCREELMNVNRICIKLFTQSSRNISSS